VLSSPALPILGPESAITRYQIQLRVDDKPGSLAALAGAFAVNNVSINSVRQNEYVGVEQAIVTIVTHPAPVFHLDAAVEALRREKRVLGVISVRRVEGE